MVFGGFGELGAGGVERVLGERRARLDTVHEPVGELGLAEGERGAHERGQGGGVVGVGVDVRNLRELDQQRVRLLSMPLGEQQPRGGRERQRAHLWLAALAGRREQLVRGRGVLVRAALGEQAQLQGARLDGGDVAGRLQALGQRDGFGQRLLGAGRARRGRSCSWRRCRARTR